MSLSLMYTCCLGVEAPGVGLVGRDGLSRRLDVVVGASGDVATPTPVIVPGQVTPRREIEWCGGIARQEPYPTTRRESPRLSRKNEKQFPAGAIATVDDLKTQTVT